MSETQETAQEQMTHNEMIDRLAEYAWICYGEGIWDGGCDDKQRPEPWMKTAREHITAILNGDEEAIQDLGLSTHSA